jgi:hypothetical protein
LKKERRTMDETPCLCRPGRSKARIKRAIALSRQQGTDRSCDRQGAKIAVGLDIMGRAAGNGRMAGQIDGIGDDRGGGIGHGGGGRKHADRVGNPERERAAPPSRSGNAARRVLRMKNAAVGKTRARGNGRRQAFAGAKVHGNVTTVVHIGFGNAAAKQRRQDFICHRPGHRRHRRDEGRAKRGNRAAHDLRHRPDERRITGSHAQRRKFRHQFLQKPGKACHRPPVTGLHRSRLAPGLDQQIHRPVVQMQPPVRQDMRLCRHSPAPGQ